MAISQNSQEHLPGKFQADGYIFQGVLAILKVNSSTFLYILRFSNGHNSLNKLDRHLQMKRDTMLISILVGKVLSSNMCFKSDKYNGNIKQNRST